MSPVRRSERIRGFFRSIPSVLRENPLVLIGFILTAAVILLTVFSPLYIPYPADALGATTHASIRLHPPSSSHFFGTDELGRDVFSEVMYGGVFTFGAALAAALLAMAIGVPVGLLAGYRGGLLDGALMRLTDSFLAIPTILLALIIASVDRGGLVTAILAIAITTWTFHARLVRGQARKLMGEPFIVAATVAGASGWRIMRRHLLPNIAPIIIVQAIIQYGLFILFIGALGFLGLGASPPTPELGLMVSLGQAYLPNFWWISMFPGIMIFIAALGVSILGDGLREVLDPKLRT